MKIPTAAVGLHADLVEWNKAHNNYIMTAGTYGQGEAPMKDGLISGHAYTLLGA
jgi:hypothetical protein